MEGPPNRTITIENKLDLLAGAMLDIQKTQSTVLSRLETIEKTNQMSPSRTSSVWDEISAKRISHTVYNAETEVASEMDPGASAKTHDIDAATQTEDIQNEDKIAVPQIKQCFMNKWEKFEGFGFEVAENKDHHTIAITKVQTNSPAAHCGLKPSDIIIEINNEEVSTLLFSDILKLITANEDKLQLLVTDEETLKFYCDNNSPLLNTCITTITTPTTDPAAAPVDVDENEEESEPEVQLPAVVKRKPKQLTVIIDFGNNYSGYAYSYADSDVVHLNPKWVDGNTSNQLKTSTSVCVKSGKLEAFGFEAQTMYSECGGSEGIVLYENFKTKLYENKRVNQSIKITSWDGNHQINGLDLIAMVIEYFKAHCMHTIKNADQFDLDDDIQWVLTVPAVWTDTQKMFMREASLKGGLITDVNDESLALALETESATLQCTNRKETALLKADPVEDISSKDFISDELSEDKSATEKLKRSSVDNKEDLKSKTRPCEYVLIDAGGGTVDISCFRKLASGACEELHEAVGEKLGANMVNENFYHLLEEILGSDFLKHCKVECPGLLFKIMLQFEKLKQHMGDNIRDLAVSISSSFNECYKKYSGKSIAQKFAEYKTRGISINADNDMILQNNVVRSLFDPIIEKILTKLNQLLGKAKLHNVEEVIFVGGFSKNPYLQEKVKAVVKKNIVIPKQPEVSILQGAIIYEETPELIKSRIAARTYSFKAYRGSDNDKPYLTKVLEKGDKIYNGHIITRYSEFYMSSVTMELYTSDGAFTEDVDDPNNYRVGNIELLCPFRSKDDDDDKHIGDDVRIQEFCFTFGGTEIRVEGKDLSSGNKAKTTINFLSN